MTAAPRWYDTLLEKCPPSAHTVPDWNCPQTLATYQRYCVLADLLGLYLMPWQRLALAILAMPQCFELVVVVGRQQGKTTFLTVPMLDILLRLPGHSAVYSAQRGLDAERKIRQEFYPLVKKAGLDETCGVTFNNGTSDFGIHTTQGTRLRAISSEANALRGETRVALGVIDEARADKDHTRSILITPTTTVVDEAKLVISSTAGDINSIYLNEIQDKARGVYDRPDSTICLLEWSIDHLDDYDPADAKLWRSVLPAMGYTVSEKAVKRAYESMEEHDFSMEYLCRRLSLATDACFSPDMWAKITGRDIKPQGELVLSIDSPPEQDRTVAVVSDKFGQVEMIDVRGGTDTAYDWVTELMSRHPEITMVAMANNNTLRRTGERLLIAGKQVKWYDTKMMHMAASRFWEAAHSEPTQVMIRSHPIMTEANKGSFRWELGGGGWVFKRQEETEFASPLIAATLAYDAAHKPGEQVAVGVDEEAIWNAALDMPDEWDRIMESDTLET